MSMSDTGIKSEPHNVGRIIRGADVLIIFSVPSHDIDGALIILIYNLRDEFHKVIEGDTAWLLFAESGTEIALEVGGFALNVFGQFRVAQA